MCVCKCMQSSIHTHMFIDNIVNENILDLVSVMQFIYDKSPITIYIVPTCIWIFVNINAWCTMMLTGVVHTISKYNVWLCSRLILYINIAGKSWSIECMRPTIKSNANSSHVVDTQLMLHIWNGILYASSFCFPGRSIPWIRFQITNQGGIFHPCRSYCHISRQLYYQ